MSGPGVTAANDDVLTRWSDGALRVIARAGDLAPGTGGRRFFGDSSGTPEFPRTSFDDVRAWDDGWVTFYALLDGDGRGGRFAADPAGGVHLLATDYQLADFDTPNPLTFGVPIAGGVGRTADGGFVISASNYVDAAIFVASVPEPACATVAAALAGTYWLGARGRRSRDRVR
jgi:hypothetical protein